MGDAAQAGFDAADDQWHLPVGFAQALAVDDHRPIGSLVAGVARRIGVVIAPFAIGGIAIDHGVHIAGGDAEEQVGLAQGLEVVCRGPVRLGDDAHPEALRLQQTPDHRHAKAGVIDIGVTGDDDDIAAVPAQRIHLGAGHGQFGSGAEAFRPELAVGKERCCHWGRVVGKTRAL